MTGSFTIAGSSVTDGSFTVDLTTVTSDESRRDNAFQGRIMETSQFPDRDVHPHPAHRPRVASPPDKTR